VVVSRRQVQVWGLVSGQIRGALEFPDHAVVQAHLPQALLINAMDDMAVHYWDGKSGSSTRLSGHVDDFPSVEALGTKYCITNEWGSDKARFWCLQDAGLGSVTSGHRVCRLGVTFLNPGDGRLFSWADDNRILEWDLKTGEISGVIEKMKGEQSGAVGSPFSTQFKPPDVLVVWGGGFTSSCYHTPHVWNLRTRELITILDSREAVDSWVPESEPSYQAVSALEEARPVPASISKAMDCSGSMWAAGHDVGVTGEADLEIDDVLEDGLAICSAANGDVAFYHLYLGKDRIRPEKVT